MSLAGEGDDDDASRWRPRLHALRHELERLRLRLNREAIFGNALLPEIYRTEIAREERARSGFFLVPLGLIIGLALFHGADIRVSLAGLAALAVLCIAIVAAVGSSSVGRSAGIVVLCAAAGQGLALIELQRTATTIFSGEATVMIEGRVAWRDVDDRGRYRYVIDIETTERPTLSRPPERARILVSSRHEPIAIGGRYNGLVRLRPPSGPAFPGSYDFAYVPFFSGLGAYGYSLGAPEPSPGPPAHELSFTERIAALRVVMAERIRAVVPGAEGAVASALITGERAGIPDEIDEWLRITGLAHVLSISGFHMALIAGFTMLSVRAIASAVPSLPLVLSTKKIAAVAALAVSTVYLLIAGDNVATQRSWIMLVIMLGAVLIDRPALTLRNVAIAAIIVLSLNPHAVVTASFQMSFAATAALVGAYGALMSWWHRRDREPGIRRRGILVAITATLVGLALSSLIAGGATTPYGAYHFQRAAPLGGVIANVLAMPLFSFWIMPVALVAVLLMPFGLDAPFLHIVGYGLTLVFEMARILAEWFPDHATGLVSAAALILLSASLLALCFFAGRLRLLSIPLGAMGFLVLAPSAPSPVLLVFEDGKEVALIGSEGNLVFLKEKPNDFVASQWRRAFPPIAPATHSAGEAADITRQGFVRTELGFVCENDICRATTRDGLEVAWTENYELTGDLCDTADIAIVSRAIRLESCASGAYLVTLRTLRRTGSLAISKSDEDARPVVATSVADVPREWNRHRHAAWPEFWQNPDRDPAPAGRSPTG